MSEDKLGTVVAETKYGTLYKKTRHGPFDAAWHYHCSGQKGYPRHFMFVVNSFPSLDCDWTDSAELVERTERYIDNNVISELEQGRWQSVCYEFDLDENGELVCHKTSGKDLEEFWGKLNKKETVNNE
jgi:hypothetical protein